MEESINYQQKEEWNKIINRFHHKDVYHLLPYSEVFMNYGDGIPYLFYYEDEYGKVANIFFKRDISKIEKLKGVIESKKLFDITTPYGYGGPIYEGTDIPNLAKNYSKKFNEYCIENNIVSEFIRFDPLIDNHKFLKEYYDVVPVRTTVYVDLSKGLDYIWKDFKGRNRNDIRKAIKSGVKIKFGREENMITSFKKLYKETMKRNNACDYYYFNNKFFSDTLEKLKDNSIIFIAEVEDKVIAASIILYTEEFVHYHLGGSLKEYGNLCANALMLYEVIKWGCNNNKKIFHLGGGYLGDNDSLFGFKSKFSKSNRYSFFIGRKIFNEDKYKYLAEITNSSEEKGYFPIYRA